MVFDNRRISEIDPQEVIDLIGNQEENLWVDFKQQSYHRDPNDSEKHKREICKDVTSMANAEGGYILIGVSETNKIAQGFFNVSNADRVATSIRDTCLQLVDPRIPNLEVERYSLRWENKDIDLVIIYIPPSGMRPHSFRWGGATNFVKRYGDVTREFPISELIQDLLARYQPPFMDSIIGQIGQIDNQLTSILRGTRRERMNLISPQDNPLDVDEYRELARIMELRFHEVISDQSYYRILAVPKELDPEAIDTRGRNIRGILQNPPNIRQYGFGVTGIMENSMVRSPEGVRGRDMYGEIILLKNGFLEVQCPLSNSHFQWMHERSRISTHWLYPHVVCEFPVSFLKLVKAIYEASGINSSIFIQQEYHNLVGFMLPRVVPSDPFFHTCENEQDIYRHSTPIVSERTVESNFVPDYVACELVKEVYDHFGLDKRWIPAFDENGNFIL